MIRNLLSFTKDANQALQLSEKYAASIVALLFTVSEPRRYVFNSDDEVEQLKCCLQSLCIHQIKPVLLRIIF